MTPTLTPAGFGLPAGFGIPVDVLRALFGSHPDGVLTSPTITTSR